MSETTPRTTPPDSLAAAASVALQLAVQSARRAAPGAVPARLLEALERLPAASASVAGWLAELRTTAQPYALPSDSEAATRSEALTYLLRVMTHAEAAASEAWEATTRHRNLLQAGIFAGVLARLVHDEASIDARIEAVVSEKASKASKSRAKIKAVEAARTFFDEWKAGFHSYPSNIAFARAACDRFDLASPEHLAKQVGKWERQRLAARGRS